MSNLIDIITSFYVSIFTCTPFLYFLASFAFLSVVLIILRIVRG